MSKLKWCGHFACCIMLTFVVSMKTDTKKFLNIWVALVTNGDWKRISITNLAMTKNIWSPSNSEGVLDGDWIVLIAIQHTPTIRWQLKFFNCLKGLGGWGGGGGEFFFKNDTTCAPPFGNRKTLITFWNTPIIKWQLKRVQACVMMVEKTKFIPSWEIEEFCSPSNGVGVLDGNWSSSITMW